MQRKQLERRFNVTIYRTNSGYVVVLPEGEKQLSTIANVEKFLKTRERIIYENIQRTNQ